MIQHLSEVSEVDNYSTRNCHSAETYRKMIAFMMLDALLLPYNLTATVNFPTRIQKNSSTAIDNIFIDTHKFRLHTVSPIYNGLSDHDAQLLTIKDLNFQITNLNNFYIRNINKYSVEEFKFKLSFESWDSIFSDYNSDADILFNNFLNNYLRIVYSSFPRCKLSVRSNRKLWITTGIQVSCNHKRQLYSLCKNSSDTTLIEYYKQYCKI
jgi:hypothetical protein